MLREGLGCALQQHNGHWDVEDRHVFQEMGDSWGRPWVQTDVGLLTQSPVKVIVPHFKFSTCLRAALHTAV